MPIPSLRAGALLLPFVLAACTSASESKPNTPPQPPAVAPPVDAAPAKPAPHAHPPPKPAATVSATLNIDPKPGSKQFQGVWLEQADGSRLLIDYRATGIWKPFDGQKVKATGHVYQPRGQAIRATHYHVNTLEMADPQSSASIVAVGPLTQLSGAFVEKTVPSVAKGAGDKYTVFVADKGTSYLIANPNPKYVGKARVSARPIRRSPFITHRGGPTLWILDVSARP